MLNFSFTLLFLRGKHKKLFIRSCLLKNSREFLLLTFWLLRCFIFFQDNVILQWNQKTVSVYHHSQTVTLSQDLLEVFPLFLTKVHTFIMVKANSCRHFCTLQPFIPFHHFIIPKELLEFSSTSGLLHYIQVHIPDNSLKQMNTLC